MCLTYLASLPVYQLLLPEEDVSSVESQARAREYLVDFVVAGMMADREITRVADVVSRTGIGERRLQRLFAEYVEASPKWVIRRYRLQEAAERLAAAEDVDLAALALDLGYFDQAHFARDFRAIVGRPPASYARSAAAAARP